MAFDYRVAPLPPWPGKSTPPYARKRPQFKTIWSKALHLLGREIAMLRGKNVEIAVDIEERHLRLDGQLRADARPKSPAVIVSFDTKQGRLAFPCDTYTFWQENVDAIARALEALRMVDRYGVQQGKQYTGFKAIPPTTGATLTTQQAAEVIARHSGWDGVLIIGSPVTARQAIRIAMNRTHPDSGRENGDFAVVGQAKAVLERHFGGGL